MFRLAPSSLAVNHAASLLALVPLSEPAPTGRPSASGVAVIAIVIMTIAISLMSQAVKPVFTVFAPVFRAAFRAVMAIALAAVALVVFLISLR